MSAVCAEAVAASMSARATRDFLRFNFIHDLYVELVGTGDL